jgi:hypothetical protein
MTKLGKLALLAIACAAGLAAAADHGGKIKWTEPKNLKDFEGIVAQSGFYGKPILMFFTMDG